MSGSIIKPIELHRRAIAFARLVVIVFVLYIVWLVFGAKIFG
jgi:hypothetical protein